jgi:hypothetical protein
MDTTEHPEDAESCCVCLGREGDLFSCFFALSMFGVDRWQALRALVILPVIESIAETQSTSVS